MKFFMPCFARFASENSISGLFRSLTQGLEVSWVSGLSLLAWPPTGMKQRISPGFMLEYALDEDLRI